VQNLIGDQPSLKCVLMAVSLVSSGSRSLLAASMPASVAPCIAATSARVDSKRSERWIPSPRLVTSWIFRPMTISSSRRGDICSQKDQPTYKSRPCAKHEM